MTAAAADDRLLDRELMNLRGRIAVAAANGNGLDAFKAALIWVRQNFQSDVSLRETAKQEIRGAAERHLVDLQGAAVLDEIYLFVFPEDASSDDTDDAGDSGQPRNQDQPRLRPLMADEFLRLELPPRRTIIDPWLPEKGLAMIYSLRGMGKTLLATTSAYAIATGSSFLGFKTPSPRKVLYIDGEMPARTMQERLAAIVAGFEAQPPDPTYFRMLSGDLTEGGLPDLGSVEGQAEFDELVGDAEVIIPDNISTLVRSGKENEAEGWANVQEWALGHRRAGRSVVFVHHANKNGGQRGTSKREDVLDTVIVLKRPADYSPEHGARFEVHFEKSRGFFGEAAQPFETRYELRDGAAVWTRAPISDAEVAAVLEALGRGSSIRDAARELGINKSKVERLKKRAETIGMRNG
jgi:putative DNA primase/helicase